MVATNNITPCLLLALSLGLSACALPRSDSHSPAIDLPQVLALGKLIDITPRNTDHEIDLMVKVYEVPILENTCFVETHGVCQHAYFIAVSTYDEFPDTNVFQLSNIGVLRNYTWLPDEKTDFVEIEFAMDSYTATALANNKGLKNQPYRVQLQITPKEIKETLLK